MQRLPTTLTLLFAVITFSPFAHDLPRESILEALDKDIGQAIFIAVATKTELTGTLNNLPQGRVTLKIRYCLKDSRCVVNDELQLDYTVNQSIDGEFPVTFPIGHEIIFVLSRPLSQVDSFNSSWTDGIDRAYICKTYQTPISQGGEANCNSIYSTDHMEKMNLTQLLKYVH